MKPALIRHLVMVALAGLLSTIILPVSSVNAGSVQGGLWTWGYGGYGQLGNGNTSNSATPVQLSAPAKVTDASAGCYHSLAIMPDNTVWSWGYNGFGQLGIGTDTNATAPAEVGNLTAATVAGGCYHSLALKADGTVWAWGNNSFGELGIGGPAADTCLGFGGGGINCSKSPVQVANLTNVVAIVAGIAFSLALKSDGTVWAWGQNYGKAPTQVSGLTDVTAIAAGSYHALAVKANGTVWAWGQDLYDSLGSGATGTTYIPVQVPQLTNIVAVSAGGWHSLALASDGTVWAWGRNSEGQIGTGTKTTSGCSCVAEATQVAGLDHVTMIAGSLLSTFALRTDGTVYAWGSNSDGEFANGTSSAGSASPVQAGSPANVSLIAAGAYHVLSVTKPASTTPPTTSIAFSSTTPNGQNGWYVTPVKVTVSATDPDDAVTSTNCELDPSSAPSGFGDLPAGCAYDGPGADVTADGQHTVYAASEDAAGNQETPVSASFKIDQTPPSVRNVTVSPATLADGGTATLTADVSDSLSGVVAAEDFAGADPGQGNGTAMTIVNGSASSTLGAGLAPGTHVISVRAQDAAGNWSNPVTVQLTVRPGAPSGLSAKSPTRTPVLSWNAVSGATSYNVYRDGNLIGTTPNSPYTDTSAAPGTYTYQVTAVTAGQEGDPSNSIDVIVGIPPTFTSVAAASTGMRVPFDFTITTSGSPTPSLTESGALPAGITFTDNGDGTADIAGIAAAGTNATYPITITAANDIGAPVTQAFALTVTTATSAPAITSAPTDTETFGAPFTFTITTTGYPAPKLTKTGGLPPGVTFTSNGDGTGTLAGTAAQSAVGKYALTLTAKNSAGTATSAFTLTITKAPVIKKVANFTVQTGTAFSKTITAVGSPIPALTQTGTLPANVRFTDNHDGTGTVAGTPATTAGGAYSITVTATNSLGSSSQTFTLKVDQPPAFTSPDTASAPIGSPFSFQITTTGYPAPRLTKLGTLPKGLTFKAGAGTITGTPASGTTGSYLITITAKNSSGSTTQTITITVS